MKTWDFDHCHDCRRFRARRGKGLNNWGYTVTGPRGGEYHDEGHPFFHANRLTARPFILVVSFMLRY